MSGGAAQGWLSHPSPCVGTYGAWPEPEPFLGHNRPFPPSSRKCLSGSVVSLSCSRKYRGAVCTFWAHRPSCHFQVLAPGMARGLLCGCKSLALAQALALPCSCAVCMRKVGFNYY